MSQGDGVGKERELKNSGFFLVAQGTFVVMAKTIVPKSLGFALVSGSVTICIKHLDRPSPKDYKEYSTFSLYVLDSGVAFSILLFYGPY